MKSVKYFIYMAFAATALLAACGKSNSTTASVPNNCAVNQGYNSTAGCVNITSGGQCSTVGTGQIMGVTSSGQCVAVECVNNGSGCVATNSGGYYNNGVYTNGAYYGSGYGSGYGNLPPVYGQGFYPTNGYAGSGYGSYGSGVYGYGSGYYGSSAGGYYPGYGYGYGSGVNAGVYVHFGY